MADTTTTTKKKRKVGRPRKERRGGVREGAGRPKGSGTKENPRNKYTTFSVSEKTLNKIHQLREITKHDELTFNAMFSEWVDEIAKDYGIE